MKRYLKRYIWIALIGAACRHPAPGATTPSATPTPRAAVDAFLKSVSSQDLQAMSVAWGTANGPARDQIDRAELEKRELLMMCYLGHDRYRVGSETPGEGGRRLVRVELTRAGLTRTTTFTTIRGPNAAWFVESAELEPVKDLCKQGGLPRPS